MSPILIKLSATFMLLIISFPSIKTIVGLHVVTVVSAACLCMSQFAFLRTLFYCFSSVSLSSYLFLVYSCPVLVCSLCDLGLVFPSLCVIQFCDAPFYANQSAPSTRRSLISLLSFLFVFQLVLSCQSCCCLCFPHVHINVLQFSHPDHFLPALC